MDLRADCDYIVQEAIRGVQPAAAVKKALRGKRFAPGRIVLVAIGKAAFSMAKAAKEILGGRLEGVVITKYGHTEGTIDGLTVFEGGHPVPDSRSLAATEAALAATEGLTADDTVLLLISGGGSALFEAPLVPLSELQALTGQLLACGADIVEINTIRKRLSGVKGGRFAVHCKNAHVFAVVLSDIVGDPLDMIASGPVHADCSTCNEAIDIAKKYSLSLTAQVRACLETETPKLICNVETVVTGSVRELCRCAADAAQMRGYAPMILTDCLAIQAREAGAFLAAIARYHQDTKKPLSFIAGGETVVKLRGTGKGGRNQELALAAAEGIMGCQDTAIFSVGSDGTDGPTDAAGGYVDGETAKKLMQKDIFIYDVLRNNDAYHALQQTNGLIFTGATGTNVNDVAVLLVRR